MDPLKYYYDKEFTREAQTIEIDGRELPILFNDDDPVGSEPKRVTFYVRFRPQNSKHYYMPDGNIEVMGDARLVESSMPRQVRAGGSFALTFEWIPRDPPMTEENLEPLSFNFRVQGRLVAPARE